MLILGVDRVHVQENRIEKNDFVGIGMIDWCVALGDPGCAESDIPPGFEDTALDYVQVVGNKFAGNHTGSYPTVPFPGADILYVDLGQGMYDCQSDNKLIKTSGSPPPGSRGPKPALAIALPVPLPACE
jgi:hypothetical protein